MKSPQRIRNERYEDGRRKDAERHHQEDADAEAPRHGAGHRAAELLAWARQAGRRRDEEAQVHPAGREARGRRDLVQAEACAFAFAAARAGASKATTPAAAERAGSVVLTDLTRDLSIDEIEARRRALEGSKVREVEERRRAAEDAKRRADEEERRRRERDESARRQAEEEARIQAEAEVAPPCRGRGSPPCAAARYANRWRGRGRRRRASRRRGGRRSPPRQAGSRQAGQDEGRGRPPPRQAHAEHGAFRRGCAGALAVFDASPPGEVQAGAASGAAREDRARSGAARDDHHPGSGAAACRSARSTSSSSS